MTNRFYGVSTGGNDNDVVESGTTTSKDFEFRCDFIAGMSQATIIDNLEKLKRYLLRCDLPTI